MTVKYTDMQPDWLYLFSGHLFCVKGGRYYRLPYKHFSGMYLPIKQIMDKYEMEKARLVLVAGCDHPENVKVYARWGRPAGEVSC